MKYLLLALTAAAIIFSGCEPPPEKRHPPKAPKTQKAPAAKTTQPPLKKAVTSIPAVKRAQRQNERHIKELEKAMDN